MTAKPINQRHIWTSLLLVFALSLLGLQTGFSKTQSRGEGEGFKQMHEQVLALRGAETKPSARKIQPTSLPLFVCPTAQVLVAGFRPHLLWTLQPDETVGRIFHSGEFRGRAPPALKA